jgi:hypothetical protein
MLRFHNNEAAKYSLCYKTQLNKNIFTTKSYAVNELRYAEVARLDTALSPR